MAEGQAGRVQQAGFVHRAPGAQKQPPGRVQLHGTGKDPRRGGIAKLARFQRDRLHRVGFGAEQIQVFSARRGTRRRQRGRRGKDPFRLQRASAETPAVPVFSAAEEQPLPAGRRAVGAFGGTGQRAQGFPILPEKRTALGVRDQNFHDNAPLRLAAIESFHPMGIRAGRANFGRKNGKDVE